MARWLVLGGTVFLSRAVAEAALARGHEVVCVARGTSGPVPDGATLVTADRADPAALDGLRGEQFDGVVDVARMSVPWVRSALDALAATARHWTFVSSISVYADHAEPRRTVASPLLEPRDDGPADDPDAYGAVKVASENLVRDRLGDRALIARAGLICGPGDASDRFGYWPARFARGGRALVPDVPEQPVQIIDVRDLAAWIVACGESATAGTFDAVGPRSTLRAVLDEVADAVGAPDLDRVPVAPADLEAAGVAAWGGPRSLPLWLPPSHLGLTDHDPGPASDAGLRCRPVDETARGALDTERSLGLDRPRKAGLSADEEQALLP